MSSNHEVAIIALFRSRDSAEDCYAELLQRGYPSSEVNLIMSEKTRREAFAEDDVDAKGDVNAMDNEGGNDPVVARKQQRLTGTRIRSMSAEGVGVGGGVGTIVGATLAAIAAAGTAIMIPGLNVIVAGPILAALAGGGAGALTGGLVGGLVGMGISEPIAQAYHRALFEGGAILSVSAPEEDAEDLQELMVQCSGEQVAVVPHKV